MAGFFIARMANHPVGGETWLNKSLSRGVCFSTEKAMVCLSEGMTLTIRIFQMKLFNAIAAAAVIGAAFSTISPVQSYERAPNGWVHIATATDGEMKHEKLESYAQNRYVNVLVADTGGSYPKTIDCVKWMRTFDNDGGGWKPILPGTVGNASARYWCNR